MTRNTRRLSLSTAFIVLIALCRPSDLRADTYVSPFIGVNFGGDAGCRDLLNCESRRLNLGVSAGVLGTLFGAELEFGWAPDFFGDVPGLDSNVLTLMGNIMVSPPLGPVRPYLLAGAGLMRTHAEIRPFRETQTDDNTLGWGVGGGLFVFFTEHLGVRGDLRYFHSFERSSLLGIRLPETKLDFGRAAAAFAVRF